ncbi:MAG: CoA transferase, partial [Rhodospirillales bacterium]|nr:CoA transferase [Rhodospirillales bacterium]
RRQEVHAMIEEITKAKPVAYWIKNMNEAGIPCGPINSIDQAFEDPQVKHLGIAQDVQSKTLGTLTMPGQPVELSRTPSRLAAATPAIGEHTDEILAELGYGADDIAGFKESGAL